MTVLHQWFFISQWVVWHCTKGSSRAIVAEYRVTSNPTSEPWTTPYDKGIVSSVFWLWLFPQFIRHELSGPDIEWAFRPSCALIDFATHFLQAVRMTGVVLAAVVVLMSAVFLIDKTWMAVLIAGLKMTGRNWYVHGLAANSIYAGISRWLHEIWAESTVIWFSLFEIVMLYRVLKLKRFCSFTQRIQVLNWVICLLV